MLQLHHAHSPAQHPKESGTSEEVSAVSRVVDFSARPRPRYICPITGCPYSSTKRADVQRHLDSKKHGDGVRYECPDVTDGIVCGQVIQGRTDNLVRHVLNQHNWSEDQVRTRIGPISRATQHRRAANARSGANDREVRWVP